VTKPGRRLLLPTFVGYQRPWVTPDLIAGLTLAAIAVPEQMATARLANMPAVTGLYAFVVASCVFALIGAHRNMSVGADSTIAPVFATGVATVAVAGSANYTHLVSAVALGAGVLLVAAGAFRLAWIADFLPSPVVTGVLAGIGVEILTRQLATVLGVPGGGTTTIGRLRHVFDQRNHVNGWAVLIAAASLFVVVASEKVDRRIPGALIALAGSTVAVVAFGLRSHGLSVLGTFKSSLPSVGVPSVGWDDCLKVAGTVLTVVFLCIVQVAATARSRTGNDPEDSLNTDLLAVGTGSFLSGLIGSFAVNASPPRTAIVEGSGGKSQATSLVAAALVVAAVAGAGLIKDLPSATLGAILVFVATRLFHLPELRKIFAFDRFEFGLCAVTVLVVGFVGIEQGVVVAGVLALAQRTRLAARPRGVLLGREPGTDHWIPTDIGRPAEQVPGVVVYLPYAALWYANASFVFDQIRAAVDRAAAPVKVLVLDADGMSDIDYTAIQQFAALVSEMRSRGIAVRVARSSHLVHHDLKHAGLLTALGPNLLYPTVQDAVAISPKLGMPAEPTGG
jgi:MFS superfamily sulfate permease-like transporter